MSSGIDNDTAQFSVNSIHRWLDDHGPTALSGIRTHLMITADGGGSNGSRVKLFKIELHKLADETGLTLQVGPSDREAVRFGHLCDGVVFRSIG